jgi:uncharacterized protein (TIGR00106 family)
LAKAERRPIMAIMEISVTPIGTKKTSVSDYVVDAVKVLERRGMKHLVGPMGTVVEAPLNELFEAAREMHEEVFADSDVLRIVTTIRIDDRRDIAENTMERKIKSLKEKMRYKK